MPDRPTTLSVLMPVYNEARTLREIVARVLAAPVELDIELVCVDDASQDGSLSILHELADSDSRIKVVAHQANRGKGAAIRTAIDHMTAEVAIVQDSDLEYDPAEYPRILKPILDGRADAVFGSRFAASPERRVLLYWHSLGNKVLTWLTNVLNDLNLTDMETCYKAVRGDIHKNLRLRSERFGIEPEITTRLAQWGARIYEVPISYHGRSYAEGKSIGWRDGVQAIWLLVKLRFLDTRFTVHDGYRTLRALRRARGYHRWLLEGFQPYLGRRVLEAGCGIGSLTEQLLDAELLVCADADPFYTELIARRFGHLANLQVVMMDLAEPAAYAKLEGLGFDTVVCVNVLEHIDRANWALSGFREVLRPGGHAIVLVPAHRWLYSEADRRLGHHRRYSDREIREALAVAGFEVVAGYQFNRLGVLGWVVNRALGRTSVSSLQMLLFELLVPLARMIDRWGRGPGLSLVVVGRRPEES